MIYWSIHESELLAQHVGINVLKHKVIAFTTACSFAGLTGALYAHYHTYINPKTFDIWQSEFSLVHIIVGGLSTVVGPVLGASILTIVDELLAADRLLPCHILRCHRHPDGPFPARRARDHTEQGPRPGGPAA